MAVAAVVLEDEWPVFARHVRAAEWLGVWADLGRAPRTIDAYARGLAEYLELCERDGVDPISAGRVHVAAFVRELTSRPSRRGRNVLSLDSGAGLANATLQQRLVPVRLFYDEACDTRDQSWSISRSTGGSASRSRRAVLCASRGQAGDVALCVRDALHRP